MRQKTRWTTEIVLQGWRNLGWKGGLSNLYFLARDRKGIAANLLVVGGYGVTAFVVTFAWAVDSTSLEALLSSESMAHILLSNLGLMATRAFQRIRCVANVYGLRAALPVLLRWPLGSVINASAAFFALKSDLVFRVTKASLTWAKTEHELPQFFGQPAAKLGAAAGR